VGWFVIDQLFHDLFLFASMDVTWFVSCLVGLMDIARLCPWLICWLKFGWLDG
jgi:hypothetical protein